MGAHQTPGDIEEIREIIEAFGLKPVILPDISGSLDGHVPDTWVATSFGGTRLDEIERMGRAMHTIVIGEHMRAPAVKLEERTGVAFSLFPTLTGLEPVDRLMVLLSTLSGKPVPGRLKRKRSQLVDAMMDTHFHFGGKRVAIGADPDLLYSLAHVFAGLGAEVVAAVSSTSHSPLLASVPAAEVEIGDLQSLEDRARACDAELLVTNAHGNLAAERLGIPLMRVGFPIFDRLGHPHKVSVGYAGTRDLLFEIANVFISAMHRHTPADFAPALVTTTDALLKGHGHAHAPAQTH
jgi:nitrogenase molybdenum-iron protein NifN